MPKQKNPQPTRVFTFNITIEESDPPIWRRLQVTDTMTLGDLHNTIQIVMGWQECHLHEFEIGKTRYGAIYPEEELSEDEKVEDESKVLLGKVIKKARQRFTYVYDFGDYWVHTIVLESTTGKPIPGQQYPVCLDGMRSGPFEDSGGMWGYQEKIAILANPDHKEYARTREWMGEEDFDPEAFDLEEVNEMLADFQSP